jgi:hypothetical protein
MRADWSFGENAQRYYEYLRENDLCMTHTLITPRAFLGAAKAAALVSSLDRTAYMDCVREFLLEK